MMLSPGKSRKEGLDCSSPGAKSLLLQLPEHVLTAAFEQLDNRELAALRLAGRELLGPASAAVRQLKPSSLAADLQTFAQLRKLDLTGVRPEEWQEELLASLALVGLTSLSVGRVGRLTLVGTEAIGDLVQLRSLELTEAPLQDSALRPLSRLSRLQSLSLRDCCKLTDQGLKVLGCLKQLESLDLSMCWQLTDETLDHLAASLPRLARLDLAGCERFTAAGLHHLCRLPALRTLNIPACYQLDDACMEAAAAGMPQLRCLGLFEAGESVTDEGLARLSALSNLTGLDLGYSCWAHSSVGLKELLCKLTGLQMLNIGGCEGACDGVMEAVGRLSKLTQLDVSECQRVTQRGVQQLARLPRLAELSLGWNLRLPGAALEALASAGSPVTKLDLSFCGEMGDAALRALARLPALKQLCLRKCTRVSDAGLRALERCSSLETLDLSYCQLITPEGLKHLAGLPALRTLTLVDCPRAATVLGMRALAGARGLRSLDVSDNKRLDDGCMQALSFTSQLTALSIRACPKVSDHGVLALARITHLRELDIDLCVAVTPAGVARLQPRLPLLKRLRPSLPNVAAQVLASNARLV